MTDRGGVLGLTTDELASCVQCGLCLPHCPTYRTTGLEARSPRGRIAAMREVEWEGAPVDADFVDVIDSCVGCLGCETACPSAVPYGRLLESTRAALVVASPEARSRVRWQRLGLRALTHPRLLRAGALAVAVAQRLGLGPALARRNVPRLPVRRPPLAGTGTDVVLVTGCVMDAVERPVHTAALRVLAAAGVGAAVVPSAGCCGALALHSGLPGLAAAQMRRMVRALPADVPVLVDAAGCGAALRQAGHVLGDAEGERFAERVRDVSSYLAELTGRLPVPAGPGPVVAVQDPCHLRHAQRDHLPVRELLAPFATVVELDDEGLCCGAGGSYGALHPQEAAAIRDRKVAAVERSGAPIVVSANPGCTLHLRAAGLDVRHPVQVVDERIGRSDGGR